MSTVPAFGTSLFPISWLTLVRNNTNSKQNSKERNPHKFQNDAVSIRKRG